MCITKVKPETKESIVSIVVHEFHGIDNLPKKIEQIQGVKETAKIEYEEWRKWSKVLRVATYKIIFSLS